MTKKRVRSVPIYVWVRPDELEVIRERMAEAGIYDEWVFHDVEHIYLQLVKKIRCAIRRVLLGNQQNY